MHSCIMPVPLSSIPASPLCPPSARTRSRVRTAKAQTVLLTRPVGRVGMAILEWDELCKMPDGAADARGEQKEALAEVAHSLSVCSKRGQLIRAAKRSRTLRALDAYEKGNVRDAERTYLRVCLRSSLPSLWLYLINLYSGARLNPLPCLRARKRNQTALKM